MTGTSISCIGRSSGSRRIAVRFYRRVRYGRCRSSGRHCSRSFFRKWCRCIFRYRCRRIHRIVGIHKADILFLAVHLCIGMCSHNCFQITGLSVRYCYFHIINGIVIMSVFQLSRLLGNAVSVYARNSIFHCRKFCFPRTCDRDRIFFRHGCFVLTLKNDRISFVRRWLLT